MNYKDLKKFKNLCKETGRPFTFEELKKWQDVKYREIRGGINWVWYYTDTREDAEAWFRELTGSDPGLRTIVEPATREPAGEHDDKYGFRLHR